jgi:hypothetical protein
VAPIGAPGVAGPDGATAAAGAASALTVVPAPRPSEAADPGAAPGFSEGGGFRQPPTARASVKVTDVQNVVFIVIVLVVRTR